MPNGNNIALASNPNMSIKLRSAAETEHDFGYGYEIVSTGSTGNNDLTRNNYLPFHTIGKTDNDIDALINDQYKPNDAQANPKSNANALYNYIKSAYVGQHNLWGAERVFNYPEDINSFSIIGRKALGSHIIPEDTSQSDKISSYVGVEIVWCAACEVKNQNGNRTALYLCKQNGDLLEINENLAATIYNQLRDYCIRTIPERNEILSTVISDEEITQRHIIALQAAFIQNFRANSDMNKAFQDNDLDINEFVPFCGYVYTFDNVNEYGVAKQTNRKLHSFTNTSKLVHRENLIDSLENAVKQHRAHPNKNRNIQQLEFAFSQVFNLTDGEFNELVKLPKNQARLKRCYFYLKAHPTLEQRFKLLSRDFKINMDLEYNIDLLDKVLRKANDALLQLAKVGMEDKALRNSTSKHIITAFYQIATTNTEKLTTYFINNPESELSLKRCYIDLMPTCSVMNDDANTSSKLNTLKEHTLFKRFHAQMQFEINVTYGLKQINEQLKKQRPRIFNYTFADGIIEHSTCIQAMKNLSTISKSSLNWLSH